MEEKIIDLRSDTVTKPTAAMRKAIFEAEVGDDVYREDPTVLRLEETVAKLFEKEAALYFPTATMANLSSVMAHCWERGSEILVGDLSHIYLYEQGGAAQLAGIHTRSLKTKPDGTFDLEEIISKIRSDDEHEPKTALLCLENTHNRCGGVVLSLEYMEQIGKLAKTYNIPIHMDGARIMNAAVKLEVPVASLLKHCDSVSICLSKGLAAPVGALVAGSSHFIKRLLRCRKVLGGGMRQVGVIAAAGLVAINTMIERLKNDHDHAQIIAKAIHSMKSDIIKIDLNTVQTNMIYIHINPSYITAEEFCLKLTKPTEEMPIIVKISASTPTIVRCVLHVDVHPDDVQLVIKKIQQVISNISKSSKTE